MVVLVVGGAGYIGSHVLKELLRAGIPAVCLDDLSSGHAAAVQRTPMVVADMADGRALRSVVTEHGVDSVIHLAAKCAVDESVRDPSLYYDHNLRRPLQMLDTLLALGVRRIVFSSTAAVYGEPESLPIPEDHPTRPINPYGRTKLYFEHVLRDYAGAYGLRYIILRYFNAAGSDPEGVLGEDHRPETHLIKKLVHCACSPDGVAQIYGTDYPTADGTPVRDFIHVTDLARAHVLAVRQLEGGPTNTVYNLGSGRGVSVQQVISAVCRVCGRDLPAVPRPRRAGDAPALVASWVKAARELGWKPLLSDLETIVTTTYDWFRSHPGGYGP